MPNSSHNTTIPSANLTQQGKAVLIRFVKQTTSGGWSTHHAPAYNSSKGLYVITKSDGNLVTRTSTRQRAQWLASPTPKKDFRRMCSGAKMVLASSLDLVWAKPVPKPEHDELSSEDELSDNVVSLEQYASEATPEPVVNEVVADAVALTAAEEKIASLIRILQATNVSEEAIAAILHHQMA